MTPRGGNARGVPVVGPGLLDHSVYRPVVGATAGHVKAGPADIATPGPADMATPGPADTTAPGPAAIDARGPADTATPGPADTPGPTDPATPDPGPGPGGYSAASLRWCSVALLWLVSR